MPSLSTWVDWTSIPAWYDVLGVVGFAFALVQLWGTKRALTNARLAYIESRNNLAAAQIQASVPALAETSDRLDESISASKDDESARQLRSFSRGASELAELLNLLGSVEGKIVENLRQTADNASAVQSLMYGPEDSSEKVLEAATQIRTLTSKLYGVSVNLKFAEPRKLRKRRNRGRT